MKSRNILTATTVLLLAVGCMNDIYNQTSGVSVDGGLIIYGRMVSERSSRTAMNDETFGDVVWSDLDAINVFSGPDEGSGSKYVTEKGGGIAEFRKETVDPESEVKGGATGYTAIYPYSTENGFDGSLLTSYLPVEQKGIKANFDPKALLTAGHSETEEIGFYNVCGGIRISVSNTGIDKVIFRGNDNESIAGPITITFNDNGVPGAESASEGGEKEITLNVDGTMESGDGNYYYITMIPQTLSKGFTMVFFKGGSEFITTQCDASVSIKRGVFSTIHLADDQNSIDKIMNSEDLSINGTANCYIINKPGAFKFKTVEGNTDFPIKEASTAEVLWETDNSADPIEAGSLIKLCFYSNGYVNFRTPSELNDGNAVIAVKDNSGTILWSWHIWICEGYDAEAGIQKYTGCDTYFMDRNLGALTAFRKSDLVNGLFYQWGRKDPFPGAAGVGMMATTPEINSVMVDAVTGTVRYSIEHPATFILSESVPFDWYYKNGEPHTLWQDAKGIYDPCPYGWKLPMTISDKSGQSSWYGIEKKDCRFELLPIPGVSVPLDSDDSVYAFYPANGYLRSYSGKLEIHNVGDIARYWSCSYSTSTANAFEIIIADGVLENSLNISQNGLKRYEGHSVRCVKDFE